MISSLGNWNCLTCPSHAHLTRTWQEHGILVSDTCASHQSKAVVMWYAVSWEEVYIAEKRGEDRRIHKTRGTINKFWPFIKTKLKLSHLKGSREKQRQNVKKILVVAGESNPGPLALATSALTTELQQPTTSMTFTFYLYRGTTTTIFKKAKQIHACRGCFFNKTSEGDILTLLISGFFVFFPWNR